jgi:cyclohexyl-isocyanide hydratase
MLRSALRGKKLNIGILIFPLIDQIDFTGPFEVLARIPESAVHVIGTEPGPIKDHKGLILTAESVVPEVPALDVLQVPGGRGTYGQRGGAVADPSARHIWRRALFVCTGALICGSAGVLRGPRAQFATAARIYPETRISS